MSLFKGIDTLDTIQIALVITLAILITNYIYMKWALRGARYATLDNIEAFANPEGPRAIWLY